jgi:hypothetical protein
VVVARVEVGQGFAVDDHLRPLVGRRFEQDRIEVGVRRDTGRQRLQRLCAADLAAVDGDR